MKTQSNKSEFNDKSKGNAVRSSNIAAAKAVADTIRTSLGPRGMDKMIYEAKGDVTVTNDGATILKRMKLLHPAAKMMVELSQSQDIEAGDGTTSVVVLAGSLLTSCSKLLDKGIHATVISEAFQSAAEIACDVLKSHSHDISIKDRDTLLKIASTSLNSKVVGQYSSILAPIAVDSVLRAIDPQSHTVNLNDIKVTMKFGGTVEDTTLIDGLIIDRHVESICNVKKSRKGQNCIN